MRWPFKKAPTRENEFLSFLTLLPVSMVTGWFLEVAVSDGS